MEQSSFIKLCLQAVYDGCSAGFIVYTVYNFYIASPSSSQSSLLSLISQWLVVLAQAMRYVVIIINIAYAQIKLKPSSDVIGRWKKGGDEPDYEAFLDAINGAISGNVFFLGAGFVWTPRHFWGFAGEQEHPSERQMDRIKRTKGEGSSWAESHPAFGLPDFLNFFVSVFALYVLIEGWVFVPEYTASSQELSLSAVAVAAFSLLRHVVSLSKTLYRNTSSESKYVAFSLFTLLLGIGDFIGMFVTSLNMSDLLAVYPNTSVYRILVILCSLLAFFRAISALIFSCFCGWKGTRAVDEKRNNDLINASVGNFAWPMVIYLFPLQSKNYVGKINRSGHSVLPAVIRSVSFLRMFLLIYLNAVSLISIGNDSGIQFRRVAVVSIVCASFDFASASYMWLFLGIWEQIQEATRVGGGLHEPLLSSQDGSANSQAPNLDTNVVKLQQLQFLFYLKNWMSFYIMSIVDFAALVVSLVNITDIIFLFSDNLRWLVVILLALFLFRSLFQLLYGLWYIYKIRKLTVTPHCSLQLWKDFDTPDEARDGKDHFNLLHDFMHLSDLSFNSFVGFITMLFCPWTLTKYLLHGFASVHVADGYWQDPGLLNGVTVIKSIINVVVCFISFGNLELPIVQVVVLTSSLILSSWRGFLSWAGFSGVSQMADNNEKTKPLTLKVASLLWASSFAVMASILASIYSQPCTFAPKLCQTDASQCLGQNCDSTAICHSTPDNNYTCTCPPWLSGNGTGPCSCPSSIFSLPHFGRQTCVLPHLFVSPGDATSVLAFSLCLLLSGLVWFYEWNYVEAHQRPPDSSKQQLNFKVACCLCLVPIVIFASSYGIFSNLHPKSPNCPSFMLASGTSCVCPLSDYPVPDFERGVCVTSKSHMSQGQVAGVAVGVLVCVAVWIFVGFVAWFNRKECSDVVCATIVFLAVFALLFGLVFGLGSFKFFPVPKAACGSSSADYKLCDLNAQCLGGACVCNAGFVGDGAVCTAGVTGSCSSNATACDVAASCSAIPSAGGFSCSCPSWMSGGGYTSSPCSCPVSDYPVPDFERGVCVTSKSHMSQGQVAGVAVGVLVCVAVSIYFVIICSNDERWCLTIIFLAVFALLFGLVFGLGSSKFIPVPKAACGSSSADYKLCDLNAQCMGGACVCNAGFHGSGISCSDAQALSLSLGVVALVIFR